MNTDRERMITNIARSSHELFRTLFRPASFDWLGLDLSMAQFKALFVLAGRGPITVGALGQILQIQLPATSHAAKGLVRLGLARRLKDANDRRCTYIQLTPHAEELVDQLREGSRDAFHIVLARLADEDLAAAQRGLQAMAMAARKGAPGSGTPEPGAPSAGSTAGESLGPCLGGPDIRDLEEELS